MVFKFVVLSLLATSCNISASLGNKLDGLSFEWVGGTLFSEPALVTSKEIHLDDGDLAGRDVIVEGEVQVTGKYSTHLVISDEFGRLLIVMTKVEGAEGFLERERPRSVKVWGTVERGKKGLPYVLAKALTSSQFGAPGPTGPKTPST